MRNHLLQAPSRSHRPSACQGTGPQAGSNPHKSRSVYCVEPGCQSPPPQGPPGPIPSPGTGTNREINRGVILTGSAHLLATPSLGRSPARSQQYPLARQGGGRAQRAGGRRRVAQGRISNPLHQQAPFCEILASANLFLPAIYLFCKQEKSVLVYESLLFQKD